MGHRNRSRHFFPSGVYFCGQHPCVEAMDGHDVLLDELKESSHGVRSLVSTFFQKDASAVVGGIHEEPLLPLLDSSPARGQRHS